MLSHNFLKSYISKIQKISKIQVMDTFVALYKDYEILHQGIDKLELAVFLLSRGGKILFCNQYAKKQFSLSASSLRGSLAQAVPIPDFASIFKRWMKDQPAFIKEEMMGGGHDPKIWNIQFYTLDRTEKGEATNNELSYIVVLEDVTTEKKIQERQVLKKNIDSMQHLAASLAHEIKNPLTAIQLYLTIAKRYTTDFKLENQEKILHALSVISQEVDRLGSLTSDFLTNIRPLSLKVVRIDPESLVVSLRELVWPILTKENISLSVAVEENLPMIAGDITYIRIVLMNILKNSIEAFEQSEKKEKNIFIKLEENSPFIQITIKDNGVGIDKKLLPNIFEPYVTGKKTGSGIGLSLAHKIILEHKGDIYVQSRKGEGTRVTILLPIYRGTVHKFLG